MSKLSLWDKLGVLIKLSASSKTYVIILVVLLAFGFVLSFTTKKNKTIHKVLYGIMTAVIAGLLIASYHSSLGNMFSYMMNNFFIAFYFPTIAIYLAAIIVMNIIVWISIFSFKSSKQIKVINTNKLDIFDQASLYGNKDATSLIELSSLVFIVWIIFLILYKVILIYLRKDYKPRIKRIIVRKTVKKLPENYQSTLVPDFVYGKVPHQETLVVEPQKTEDELLLEQFSKQFTLEDYKLFSRLLKQEQEKERRKKVNFIEEENHKKIKKGNKNKKEVVVKAANTLEEDPYREQQKQVIIQMEEERRKLLREEQERQKREEMMAKQQELERVEEEVSRQQEIERQEKEEQQLEVLLQQVLKENEKEQRKLSELEMLYR